MISFPDRIGIKFVVVVYLLHVFLQLSADPYVPCVTFAFDSGPVQHGIVDAQDALPLHRHSSFSRISCDLVKLSLA